MAENLTKQDCEMLIEALDALETKGTNRAFQTRLIGTMLGASDSEEAKGKLETEMMEREEKAKEEAKGIKEKSTLLKAKLIHMGDAALVTDQAGCG